MDKKIIAIAMGAALAGSTWVAQAATTLYGHVEASINSSDIDNGGSDDVFLDADGIGVNGSAGVAPGGADNTSFFGIRGSESLGNGLNAIFQAEFGIDISQTSGIGDRDQWVGLEGGFGTIRLGTVMTSYKESGASIDPFDTTALQMPIHGMMSALHHDDLAGTAGEGRAEHAIRYDTPDISGFKGIFHWTAGSNSDAPSDDGSWGAGVHYDNGPVIAFVDYITSDAGGDDDAWKVGGNFNMGSFDIFAQYEADGGLLSAAGSVNANAATALSSSNATDNADRWMVGGAFTMGSTKLSLAYGQTDDYDAAGVTATDSGYDVVTLGAIHNLSARTRAYFGYSQTEGDLANSTDLQFWTVGVGHSF